MRTFTDLAPLATLLHELRKKGKERHEIDLNVDTYLQSILASMSPSSAHAMTPKELLQQEGLEPLTEREQQCLEHLRKAQELDVSLAEYARSFDVDVKELYSAKQSLARKGALAYVETPVSLDDFVRVKVTRRPASTEPTLVCRIQHPSGLVIECSSFPPDSWLAALLPRANDVPA